MPRHRLPRRQVLASLGAAPVASWCAARTPAITPSHTAGAPAVDSEWMLDVVLDVRLATPADAMHGRAFVLGGRASGPLLQGQVLPGSVEWSVDAERGVLLWSARFDLVAGAAHIQVADRATLSVAVADYWSAPFASSPELQSVSGPGVVPDGLYLGRMDASALGAGRLRMNLHRVL